jgi:hypothetical protein
LRDLLRCGPIRVVLFEAVHDGRPWNALEPSDLERARFALGWEGSVKSVPQVHGERILEGDESGDADGFLLRAGEAALVRHADCFPVAIADPVRSQAVLLHCGWRGCALHLAEKGVARLLALGSRVQDLHACLGPGIGAVDFEVGPETLVRFPREHHAITSGGTASIDLAGFLVDELCRSGMTKSRITCDLRSTLGDLELHSHRRAGAQAGRMATFCLVAPTGGT